jgi:hypothetical protein
MNTDNNCVNRCHGYTKNNKKCRAKTSNNKLFCCTAHEPINNDIILDGCFICSENIETTNEIIYFNCKHAFHKPCYMDWIMFSTYETPICMICRNEVKVNYSVLLSDNDKDSDKYKCKYKYTDNSKIIEINKILYENIPNT